MCVTQRQNGHCAVGPVPADCKTTVALSVVVLNVIQSFLLPGAVSGSSLVLVAGSLFANGAAHFPFLSSAEMLSYWL